MWSPIKAIGLRAGIRVETLLSNDSGVAFIVSSDDGVVYHAGDLNDWYWEGEPEEENRELRAIFHTEIGKSRAGILISPLCRWIRDWKRTTRTGSCISWNVWTAIRSFRYTTGESRM